MKITPHFLAHRGYTLIEMVAASLGASAVVVGLSSALFIAIQATKTSSTPTTARITGNDALGEILADLEFALFFSEQTATAVTFTVPDRDNDGNPETIRYAWSGTPGDPITRQYNGGSVVTFVEDVHVFQLDLPPIPPNLLVNGDMETGAVSPWETLSNVTLTPVLLPVHSGLWSLRASRLISNGGRHFRQNVTSHITNGATYHLSGWLRRETLDGSSTVSLQIEINTIENPKQVFALDPVVLQNTDFTKIEGDLTPTWSGTLQAAYWDASGTRTIYLDDAKLTLIPSSYKQLVGVNLQVSSDAQALLQSSVRLVNTPF
ncbi:MAG: carbohydrate binding domain-containing protein [Planctomycetaceae bacterium]|nr:carbohydrate binding domain-containing protein [Planctomycetaceae bacterium]